MSTQVDIGTREDVERLAREVMGWALIDGWWCDATGKQIVPAEDTYEGPEWDPFWYADADVQVLERVRETWGSGRLAAMLAALHRAWEGRWGYEADTGPILRYQIGDYARAALHVLNTENAG